MAKKLAVQSSSGAAENVFGLPAALFKIMKDNGAVPLTTWMTCDRIVMESMRLNKITGGGLPRGMISTLSGAPMSGKSTTAMHMAKSIIGNPNNWENNGYVAYWDTEYKYSPDWAAKTGLPADRFHAFRAEGGGEAMCRAILAQIESGLYEAIFIDSVKGALWNAEDDADVGDNQMAIAAKKWELFIRKALKPLRENKVALVGINHLKDKIGGAGGKYEPGGDAWNFYAVNKLRTGWPEKDLAKGILKVHLWSNKNQTAPVEGSDVWIEYNIFEDAIVVDDIPEIAEIGKDLKVFRAAGAWLYFNDEKYNGEAAFVSAMRGDPELYEAAREAVIHALEAQNKKRSIALPLAGLEDYTEDSEDDAQNGDGDVETNGTDNGREEPGDPGNAAVLSGENGDIDRLSAVQ